MKIAPKNINFKQCTPYSLKGSKKGFKYIQKKFRFTVQIKRDQFDIDELQNMMTLTEFGNGSLIQKSQQKILKYQNN